MQASNCFVAVSHADVISLYEAHLADNTELPEPGSDPDDALQEADAKHQNWFAAPGDIADGAIVEWEGLQGPGTAEEDYRAGALATCDIGDDTAYAFAYETETVGSVEGALGSIDVGGSLGSLAAS